jgi:cell division protein FtsB
VKAKAKKAARTAKEVRRSRLILVAATGLSAVILGAWFPASALYHQRSSLVGATAQLQQLHTEDAALNQEGKNLSDSAEISRIAREQYQLVSPGQLAFEVLPPSGSAVVDSPYATDPGLTGPVAPSAASELPPGGITSPAAPSQAAKAHGASAHQAEGAFQRMLHALEFWH